VSISSTGWSLIQESELHIPEGLHEHIEHRMAFDAGKSIAYARGGPMSTLEVQSMVTNERVLYSKIRMLCITCSCVQYSYSVLAIKQTAFPFRLGVSFRS
jgi:hypothetical protein